MRETSKCDARRRANGEFDSYFAGKGIDIGCGDDPLNADVRRWDAGDGDAMLLHGVPDGSLDFAYSSHCLEHLVSVDVALRNWCRVVRPGGHLYIVVPDFGLYEKFHWPSLYNPDHKWTFSLKLTRRDVGRDNHFHIGDVALSLSSQGVHLLHAGLEDDGFDRSRFAEDQTRGQALSQICVIARKEPG